MNKYGLRALFTASMLVLGWNANAQVAFPTFDYGSLGTRFDQFNTGFPSGFFAVPAMPPAGELAEEKLWFEVQRISREEAEEKWRSEFDCMTVRSLGPQCSLLFESRPRA